MNNDKDGARWRLWCRAWANPGSEVSRAVEERLEAVPRCNNSAEVVAAMTAALDEVLELYPEG